MTEIYKIAEQECKEHADGHCNFDESHTEKDLMLHFMNYGKEFSVKFDAIIKVTKARFTGDHFSPPDDDDIDIEIEIKKLKQMKYDN